MRHRVFARLRSDLGQTVIFVVILLPVIVGVSGLVVDGAHAFGEKRRTQNAADAAALAAAQSILGTMSGSCPSAGILISSVQTAAECYSLVNDGPSSLHACHDPDSSHPTDTNCYSWPYKGSNQRVEVRITRTIDGLFLDALGLGGMLNTVSARAVGSAAPQTGEQVSTTTVTNPDAVSTVTTPGGTVTTTTPASTTVITTPMIWDADYNGDDPHVTANTGCGFPGIELNNEVLNAPFISRGNVCLRGSAPGGQLLSGGENGRIDIEGLLGLTTSANRVAAVQDGTTPIASAHIGLGCRIGTVTTNPCTSAQRVYANAIDSNPQNLTRPTFDWQAEYSKATPGPMHPCDPSLGSSAPATWPVFDNNTTFTGAASATATDITPAGTSYVCRARDATGNIGELSWDSSLRKLTVSGVIFFDTGWAPGANATPIHYYGKATIFVSSPGQVTWGNSTEKWCAGGTPGVDCSSPVSNMPNWDPSQNVLWLVLGGKNGSPFNTGAANPSPSTNNDIDFKASAAFQGALYTLNTCHVHGAGGYLSGPLICGRIDTAGLGASALQFPPVREFEGGNTTTTVVTPGTTSVSTAPNMVTTTTTPGGTSTTFSTITILTGTVLGLDE